MQIYNIDDKHLKIVRKLALLLYASSVATFILVCLIIAAGIGSGSAIPIIILALAQFIYPVYLT